MNGRYAPESLGALRIATGLILLLHGSMKLLAWPFSSAGGRVEPVSLMGAAGLIELLGGSMLVLGLFTRPAAFVLAGEMAVAYFMAHAVRGFWPPRNGGELAIMLCFAALALAGNGPGAWALDSKR